MWPFKTKQKEGGATDGLIQGGPTKEREKESFKDDGILRNGDRIELIDNVTMCIGDILVPKGTKGYYIGVMAGYTDSHEVIWDTGALWSLSGIRKAKKIQGYLPDDKGLFKEGDEIIFIGEDYAASKGDKGVITKVTTYKGRIGYDCKFESPKEGRTIEYVYNEVHLKKA